MRNHLIEPGWSTWERPYDRTLLWIIHAPVIQHEPKTFKERGKG